MASGDVLTVSCPLEKAAIDLEVCRRCKFHRIGTHCPVRQQAVALDYCEECLRVKNRPCPMAQVHRGRYGLDKIKECYDFCGYPRPISPGHYRPAEYQALDVCIKEEAKDE